MSLSDREIGYQAGLADGRADPCPHCDMQHVWPCPAIPRCDEPGCDREATCGWPSDRGYRRTCGNHHRAEEPTDE